MSCGICGGEVTVNGDGDLICQGSCGEVLTREEIERADQECDTCEEREDDGQPTEYEEWQDLYGGDDWDHGQYDEY